MRIHVTVDAERNEQSIDVALSTTDGRLTFEVPNAGRASACTFSIDVEQLLDAIRHLQPVAKVTQTDPGSTTPIKSEHVPA